MGNTQLKIISIKLNMLFIYIFQECKKLITFEKLRQGYAYLLVITFMT